MAQRFVTRPIPQMLTLDSKITLGQRHYRVEAVLWLGERYYMLHRDGGKDVALMPAAIVERLAEQRLEPPKPKPKLRRVK